MVVTRYTKAYVLLQEGQEASRYVAADEGSGAYEPIFVYGTFISAWYLSMCNANHALRYHTFLIQQGIFLKDEVTFVHCTSLLCIVRLLREGSRSEKIK